MVVVGRRESVGLYVAFGVVLISVSLVLYVGWVVFNLRSVALLLLGGLLLAGLITGMVLNTFFLVRQIRRNEQQDAFINAVTHELKTPVASIRLYLETLQSRDVDPATRKEFYGTMLEDSDRLLATIEQILRTGRVGSASRKPHLSAFDLDVLVDECVQRARTMNQLSDQALTFKAGLGASVLADHEEIRAAVSNLIDNAIKYSGKNVKVVVETAGSGEDNAVVRVRDQGPGIPKTELKDIFKRFHRVPGATARIPGTGLGLYIVRSVAKRHGGRAWAESEGLGHGSTFVLQLPLAK